MFEKLKSLFRKEPVVAIAGVVIVIATAIQQAVAGLDANSSWWSVAVAVAAVIGRQFVSPVAKEPETPEQQRFWSGEPRV